MLVLFQDSPVLQPISRLVNSLSFNALCAAFLKAEALSKRIISPISRDHLLCETLLIY